MTQDLLDASVQQSGHTLELLLARTELVALARQAVDEHELVSDHHQFLVRGRSADSRGHRRRDPGASRSGQPVDQRHQVQPHGGPVHVTVKATDGPDGKSAVLVVRDEGVGIPQDDLPHVFDRFLRGANVVGRFAGTGLGLASARELVELHGGTISVESEEGKGSTFVVRLPLTPPGKATGLSPGSAGDALRGMTDGRGRP